VYVLPRHIAAILALAIAAFGGMVLAAPARAAAAPSVRAATGLHRVSPHVMGRHRRHSGAKQQSLNWAGYIRGGHGFTSASGTWRVPTVASTHDGYSSTWVGIDGAATGDGYLIQTGTEADVSGGRRSYRAWWEVITPADIAPETVFPTLAIHPGDSVSASVSKAASGRWTMRLRDNTTRHSAAHTASFAGPGSSAEWIQEDTDVNGFISAAPDWHSVTFRGLRLNGRNPGLKVSEAVDIVDSHGTREASTGTPRAGGSGFAVTWLAPGTRTAVR
jgi:Peptidase A4 family